MKKVTLFSLFILCIACSFAQGVTIGSNNPPDQSAVLDLQSGSQGFLITKLTTAQRNAIVNPAIGLQIYNTDTDCLEMYFASGGWKPVQCGCQAFPNAIFNVPQASINNPVTISAPVANMTYSWTFQNGSPATSTNQSAQVTWANAGTYAITLIVTDSAGCSSTHTDSIIVSLCQPQTITFTTCSQTGRLGPDQNQCDAAYGPGVVTVNAGVQLWTVPQTGTYQIKAVGAGGGSYQGAPNQPGLGTSMQGEFTLTAGTVLKLLVGQKGSEGNPISGSTYAGGGGGGTFVVTSANVPLIVAGGGNGNSWESWNTNGPSALLTNSGTGGGSSETQSSNNGRGGGGGGFSGNGGNYSSGDADGGLSFLNGGAGGSAYSKPGHGGFGGGGATRWEGGGGGGYTGGSSVKTNSYNTSYPSYGAGSYNSGVNQVNTANANTSHGFIEIIKICP